MKPKRQLAIEQDKTLEQVSKGMAEFCETMAELPFQKAKPKRIRCPCCKRLTKKTPKALTAKEWKKRQQGFKDRASKFRGLSGLFALKAEEKNARLSPQKKEGRGS